MMKSSEQKQHLEPRVYKLAESSMFMSNKEISEQKTLRFGKYEGEYLPEQDNKKFSKLAMTQKSGSKIRPEDPINSTRVVTTVS